MSGLASILVATVVAAGGLTGAPDSSNAAAPRLVVFTASGGQVGAGEIFIADESGANRRQLTFNNVLDKAPAWSPDGQKIVYASLPDGAAGLQLRILDTATMQIKNLTSNPEEGHSDPAWSPDGSRIAFASNDPSKRQSCLKIVTSGGDGITELFCGGAPFRPAWSPDGRRILVTMRGIGSNAIEVLDVSNPAQREHVTDGYDAVFSPDGSQITFTRNLSDSRTSQVFVAAADGTNPRQVTWGPDNHYAGDWLSNGRLLFNTEAPGKGTSLSTSWPDGSYVEDWDRVDGVRDLANAGSGQ